MYELKPCPFCGDKAIFEQYANEKYDQDSVRLMFKISCTKCGATAPMGFGKICINLGLDGSLNIWKDEREKAAKEWNRRMEDGGQDEC